MCVMRCFHLRLVREALRDPNCAPVAYTCQAQHARTRKAVYSLVAPLPTAAGAAAVVACSPCSPQKTVAAWIETGLLAEQGQYAQCFLGSFNIAQLFRTGTFE